MGRTDEVQFMLECVAEWRRLGARVTFEPGWETRGNGLQGNYEGCIVHHTASNSSAANPNPTRSILINGRPDLTGPLCNVTGPWCTDSDPWLHVIAAFPANHAGASGGRSMGPLPVTGLFNPRVLGLEIDYSGLVSMTSGQYRAACIFARGATNVLQRSTEYVRAHAESSITGKWDPGYASGKTIDMAAFRRDAAAITALEDDVALTEVEYNEIASRVWHYVHPNPAQAGPAWAIDRLAGIDYKTQVANDGIAALPGRVAQAIPAPAPVPAAQVTMDATAVANALASNQTFLKSLARAVNDDAAARLAS